MVGSIFARVEHIQETTAGNRQMTSLRSWVFATAAVAMTGAAQAAFIDRGGGMIYDTTRNITWLADMNYAFTSGYAAANLGGSGTDAIYADGRMGWGAANTWANGLVYGGFDDWRMPTVNPHDTTCSYSYPTGGSLEYYGYNCTDGELSNLFVVGFGGGPGESFPSQTADTPEQIANLSLFSNAQSLGYWSGTEVGWNPIQAWTFDAGFQGQFVKASELFPLHVLAVRAGDVPEPQALALALLALGATVVVRSGRPS